MTARKPPAERGEFALIADFFRPLAEGDRRALALGDDAAVIEERAGSDLVVTADALIGGVHFLRDDPPAAVAKKALRVNLSDLAAMGAEPFGYFLTIALAETCDERWLEGFVNGLAEDQQRFGCRLLGGDTVSTPGPVAISLTAMGRTAAGAALRRDGARPGERVFVTGTIGDATLGLRCLKDELSAPSDLREALVRRYRLPEPRLAVGRGLAGLASAAIDVSDGLAADLGHIAERSGVGLRVRADAVPLSDTAAALLAAGTTNWETLLAGGDDYELAFTAPAEAAGRLARLAGATAVPIAEIGEVAVGEGVRFVRADGTALDIGRTGWAHR